MSGVVVAPPSEPVISLTCVDLFFATVFLPLGVYIAWKHGKPGFLCWPNLIGSAVARIVDDTYLLVTRDQALVPSVVGGVTSSAVLASISLTIVGAVYMSNVVLPMPPKKKQELYILVAFSMINTIGISVAFVPNRGLQELGSTIMLFVLLGVCGWMLPTYQKIQRYAELQHPNSAPAKYMFWAAVVALPFWVVRIGASAAYAFTASPALDPTTGLFATRFILVFWTWLGATMALSAGGWWGMKRVFPAGTTVEYMGDLDERAWDRERRRTLNRARRTTMYGTAAGHEELSVMQQTVRPKGSKDSSVVTTSRSLHAATSSRPLVPKTSHGSSFTMVGTGTGTGLTATSSRPSKTEMRAGTSMVKPAEGANMFDPTWPNSQH